MTSLTSGHYIIRNVSKADGSVGRNLAEDKSLNPKKIVSLPSSIQAEAWIIEELPNGNYKLRARGSPTGARDGKVYAFLTENGDEWKVTRRENHGRNVFTIEEANGSNGWVLNSNEEYSQIECKPLTATKSFPPQFPSTELWSIVEENDAD
ncbi:hypothetical protein BDQ12DRAFT_730025 [Crucibulum laeve]|uniref:Ricin B lectin domain-containing protein n=1 Tax=Crucibulum laeve TaxID=68775 RepID=A0A5C3LE23_9AGAR|nr:hypothetical protein BDQ12DRAFT_730025 [Crucibulum laeve]